MDFAGLQDPMCGNPLPVGWKLMRLGDLGSVRYGLGQPPEQSADGVPMVRATNVKRGRLVSDGLIRIKREAIPESRNPYLCAGEIIVVRSGAYTGDVAMVTHNWAGSVVGYDLVFSSKEQIDPAFCERDRSAQPHLNRQQLESTAIPVPPVDEQRKIAAVLGLVQRAIEQQEGLIELTMELKKALLHKLFTEGLRGEPQKQTEIGPMPESWEVLSLGDVAAIERGKFAHRPRNHPRFYGGSTPFVQTGDVSNCDGKIRTFSQTLNEEGVGISKIFPAGTTLITIAANVGFSGILEFDSACPDSLIGLTPNHRISAEFLQYYLSTQQPEMDRLAPRGTQKNINIQFLKPWPIRLPPTEEQDEIVECLSVVDAKLRSAAKKRRTLDDLFRTLLHQLMTAQIGVKDLGLPPEET